MSNHKGNGGIIKVGANSIAEVKSWSLEETADTIETTTLGETARRYVPGNTSFSGSLEAFWDSTDATGQGALTKGAVVTLKLYPDGDTSGDTEWAISAIITSLSKNGSFDGMVEASFSFQGSGDLVENTIV